MGKYYANLLTQFIIGCSCYILAFFIIKDIIGGTCFDEYKYYIMLLIAIDTCFIIYKAKCKIGSTKQIVENVEINFDTKAEQTTTDGGTANIHSGTLMSEINDFKITHDLTISDNESSIFSTSDEKSDENNIRHDDTTNNGSDGSNTSGSQSSSKDPTEKISLSSDSNNTSQSGSETSISVEPFNKS